MSIRPEQATILLVDDEPALLEIVGRWLRMEGCGRVLTAPDGEAALAVLTASHVDLLMTDVRMPRMDGVGLVRSLVERDQPLPSIIFVSGFGDVDRREMYALGVEAFLSKPFRREEVLAVIHNALADRHELWLVPMETAPRQTMSLTGQVLSEGNGDPGLRLGLRLGRGGFSVYHTAPLSLSKVAFRCDLVGTDRILAGEGFIRWYSRTEQMVGVEFFYLEPASRVWVAETIRTNVPRSFIPQTPDR